jgi:hypothetical protein
MAPPFMAGLLIFVRLPKPQMRYSRNRLPGISVEITHAQNLHSGAGGCMKDIHEVLRHKQAQYAQLGKQIEMLQQAAEKLREVAPLLTENDVEDDAAVLSEVEEEGSNAMAAKASAQSAAPAPKASRSTAPRWP